MNIKMFNGNNLPHELLLTTQWKTNLRNAFENNVSTHIKLSKAQISKIIYFSSSRNYSCCFSNWCRDSKIKIHGSGATTLIISNKEMNEIMKIVQALENCNILLKGVTKTTKNEIKEQKGGFLGMLLGISGASLLGNVLSRKGIARAGFGNKKGKGIVRAGYGKEWDF